VCLLDDGSHRQGDAQGEIVCDFMYEELAQSEIGDEDQELVVVTHQLCQYLTAAETKAQQTVSLGSPLIFLHERNRLAIEQY